MQVLHGAVDAIQQRPTLDRLKLHSVLPGDVRAGLGVRLVSIVVDPDQNDGDWKRSRIIEWARPTLETIEAKAIFKDFIALLRGLLLMNYDYTNEEIASLLTFTHTQLGVVVSNVIKHLGS